MKNTNKTQEYLELTALKRLEKKEKTAINNIKHKEWLKKERAVNKIVWNSFK